MLLRDGNRRPSWKQAYTYNNFRFKTRNLALNPADDQKLRVFDPAVRCKTDQFAHRFRKPAQ